MCGRYILISKRRIKNLLNLEIQPCYNISPSMRVLILNENFSPIFLKWGLENKIKEKNVNIFNARIETVKSKLLFKKFRKCIFLSNGYLEWKKINSLKTPFFFYFRKKMMFFGGIYNKHGCIIVTKSSCKATSSIHSRQPVVLDEKEINSWLNNKYNYSSRFDEKILYHQVSNTVNLVKNNNINNIKKLEV